MSQNPQINTTENGQTFLNNGFDVYSHGSQNQPSNVLYNDNTTATSDNSLHGTAMTSAIQQRLTVIMLELSKL
jgi:hypothetical protein